MLLIFWFFKFVIIIATIASSIANIVVWLSEGQKPVSAHALR